MNDAIVFDSHRFVRNLTASGFTERQAEVLANEQVQLLNGNLATKTDLEGVQLEVEGVRLEVEGVRLEVEAIRLETANVKSELEVKIANVQAALEVKLANLDAKIASSKSDVLKWTFAALIAQGGVIVTLIKLL